MTTAQADINTAESNITALQDSLQLTDWKNQCKYTSISDLTLATTTTIQSQVLVIGDRVLVRSQATAADNGIYSFNGTGLERASDANTAEELSGATVMISAADPTLAGYIYYQSMAIVTLGVTTVTFVNIGNGSPLAVASIGSTPNAAGAIVTGSSIALQPASQSFGGVVTAGDQSFVGLKTFRGTNLQDAGITVTTHGATTFDSNLNLSNNGVLKWALRNSGGLSDIFKLISATNTIITATQAGSIDLGVTGTGTSVTINPTTVSSSTSTGALIVKGGLGVAGTTNTASMNVTGTLELTGGSNLKFNSGGITGTGAAYSLWGGGTGSVTIGPTSTSGTSVAVPCGTFNVGVTSSVRGVLKLFGTSGVVTIQPATAAGTWTLTLPTDDGTSGQVLTTDGNGVCSWATPTGSTGTTIFASISFTDNGSTTTDVGTPLNCSITTRHGGGDYTITFTSSAPNGNYLVIGNARKSSGDYRFILCSVEGTKTAASFNLKCNGRDGGLEAPTMQCDVIVVLSP